MDLGGTSITQDSLSNPTRPLCPGARHHQLHDEGAHVPLLHGAAALPVRLRPLLLHVQLLGPAPLLQLHPTRAAGGRLRHRQEQRAVRR